MKRAKYLILWGILLAALTILTGCPAGSAASNVQPPPPPAGNYTWTDQKAAGARQWGCIASSSDGTKLAAAAYAAPVGGDIYTSMDSGATWTDQTAAGSRNWSSLACSSDGTKLFATVWQGPVGASTDLWEGTYSGGSWTWTDLTATAGAPGSPSGSSWLQAVACSSDGTKLVVTVGAGSSPGIWTGTLSGTTWTWTNQTSAGAPTGSPPFCTTNFASSANFTKLALAVEGSGDVWTGVNSSGTWTWTDQTGAGTRLWNSIASSSDGSKLFAGGGSDIWISTNSGSTWSAAGLSKPYGWGSIASSSDGTKLAAACLGGDIWTSRDSGATWTDESATAGQNYWQGIACSSDGTKLAGVVSGQSSPGTYVPGDFWTAK